MTESHNQSQFDAVDAIILCGGQSKRMGRDKAWLAVDGEFFLRHVATQLQPLVRNLVVVKAKGQTVPSLPLTAELVDDDVTAEGPLSGFVTGIRHLDLRSMSRLPVWLASCDSPFFNARIFRELLRRLQHFDAVAVEDSEFLHPFSAWYGGNAQDAAVKAFAHGERSLNRVLRRCSCLRVKTTELFRIDPELDFLRSINAPEDLTWAEQNWPPE